MSRYSSDSDSSSRHRKSRRRRSRSSSSSSGHHRRSKKSRHHSSYGYKKSRNYSSKSRRRSYSRSNSNSRNSRSLSKDRRRRRSHSRSRDRYRSRRHCKSRSRSKGRSSRYRSRSSSADNRSRHSRSPAYSNSSSSSGSKKISVQNNTGTDDQLREKLLKAIKAAESADHLLKQQGVLAKGVKSRNDITSLTSVKPNSDVIKDIEKDEFVQKTFTSSKIKNSSEDVSVIDLVEDSNNIPEGAVNSIFHASFFCDPKIKLDRWIKKLYQIRQKVIVGEPIGS